MNCACGCGRKTRVAIYTHKARGLVKGQPLKWIEGHQHRVLRAGVGRFHDLDWYKRA